MPRQEYPVPSLAHAGALDAGEAGVQLPCDLVKGVMFSPDGTDATPAGFFLLLVQPCWRRYYVCRSSPYASSLKGATHTRPGRDALQRSKATKGASNPIAATVASPDYVLMAGLPSPGVLLSALGQMSALLQRVSQKYLFLPLSEMYVAATREHSIFRDGSTHQVFPSSLWGLQ